MASQSEQIAAILSWNTFRWAQDHLPKGTSIDDICFPDLISVTPQEVFEHVQAHGFPEQVVAVGDTARGADDMLCIVPLEVGRWSVYYTERGIKSDQVSVGSHAAAQRLVIEILYNSARTALNSRWWHAHPSERPPKITDME